MTKGAPMLEEGNTGTILTLTLPAQPKVGGFFAGGPQAAEVTMLALTKDRNELEAIQSAFELLETLYRRGVTDSRVLALILEATGHPKSTERSHHHPSVDTPSAT